VEVGNDREQVSDEVSSQRLGRAEPAITPNGPRSTSGRILALQRSAGNRATARLLARAPTTAERVAVAADKQDWRTVSGLLAAQPMEPLLNTLAALEDKGKLTWVEANLDSKLSKLAQTRIAAGIAVVQRASPERQMATRLALNAVDERALGAWLQKHPDPNPLPAPPELEPTQRSDRSVFDPPAGIDDNRGWVRALLRFMHFGPPVTPAPGPVTVESCTLDSQPSTLTDVALFVAEQALFHSTHLLDATEARVYVDEYFKERVAAAALAKDIEAKFDQKDYSGVIDSLKPLSMPLLLGTLDVVRADEKLEGMIGAIITVPASTRITAAMLTAGGHLGVRWEKALADLVPAEADTVRSFLFERVIYSDIPAAKPVLKNAPGEADHGRPFEHPASTPGTWADTIDDAGWIWGFLDYFNLRWIPFDEDNYYFNDAVHPLDEVLDIVVEQAALASRMISAAAVKTVVEQHRATMKGRATPDPSQIVLQYTFVPQTVHKVPGTKGTTADNPAHQVAVGYTIKFKNVGASWSEIDVTGLVQGTLFADPSKDWNFDIRDAKLQSLVAGAQAAWVIPLFSKHWQLQTIVQAVVGTARGYDTDTKGNVTIRPVFQGSPWMGQLAGQVQVVFQPFDSPRWKWVQFFAGFQGSITHTGRWGSVSPITTLDGTPIPMVGIGGTFDVGGG
jgi:hypothetical protein